MNTLGILAIANFALAAFDGYLTRRRMKDFGLWIEQNKIIQWLAAIFGIELGVFAGIMLPVAAQVLLCEIFNLPVILALLVGFRAKLFTYQLQSFKFEKAIKESGLYKKGSHTNPPGASSDDDSTTLP